MVDEVEQVINEVIVAKLEEMAEEISALGEQSHRIERLLLNTESGRYRTRASLPDKKPKLLPAQRRVFRKTEVAQLLNVSGHTLYNWIDRGRFPEGFAIDGNARGWSRKELQAWLDEWYGSK